jgi:hypothetical protein
VRRAGESGSHPLPGQVTGARHIWGSGRTGLTGDLRLEGSLTFAFPGECDQPTWAGQQGWEHAWDSSPLSTRLQGTLEFLPCLGGGGLCLSAAEDLAAKMGKEGVGAAQAAAHLLHRPSLHICALATNTSVGQLLPG